VKVTKCTLVMFAMFISGNSLAGQSSQVNNCIEFNNPRPGQVYNGCDGTVNLWWRDSGDCNGDGCLVTVRGNTSYSISSPKGAVRYLACPAPSDPVKTPSGGRVCE